MKAELRAQFYDSLAESVAPDRAKYRAQVRNVVRTRLVALRRQVGILEELLAELTPEKVTPVNFLVAPAHRLADLHRRAVLRRLG